MVLRGTFFDGQTARSHAVELRIQGGRLLVQGAGVEREYALDSARLTPPLGTTGRSVLLPDDARCDLDSGQDLSSWPGSSSGDWLQRLESSYAYVVASVVLAVATVWIALGYGIPALAARVAEQLPTELTAQIGEHTLNTLDHWLFKPTQLQKSRQEVLRREFAGLLTRLPDNRNYKLAFRNGGDIGPNAFALPSGVIVVTDQLIGLAQTDNEIIAVLAHEMGHLERRHTLRNILQASATGLITLTLTGDASSIFAVGATALIDARYSREFETEADNYAFEYLRRAGIPTSVFADILTRMDKSSDSEAGPVAFLASHPLTSERIKRFRKP